MLTFFSWVKTISLQFSDELLSNVTLNGLSKPVLLTRIQIFHSERKTSYVI